MWALIYALSIQRLTYVPVHSKSSLSEGVGSASKDIHHYSADVGEELEGMTTPRRRQKQAGVTGEMTDNPVTVRRVGIPVRG